MTRNRVAAASVAALLAAILSAHILVERLTVRQARHAFFIRGLEAAPVRGLVVRDSSFLAVERSSVLEHVEDLLLERVAIEPSSE
jgi:hypothetical protein